MSAFKMAIIVFVLLLSIAILNKNKPAIDVWFDKQVKAATLIMFKQRLINMEIKFGPNGAVQS